MKSLAATLPSKKKNVNLTAPENGILLPPLSIPHVPAPFDHEMVPPIPQHAPGNSKDLFNDLFGAPAASAMMVQPGALKLHGSIVETVDVLFREGDIEKLRLTGEISIAMPDVNNSFNISEDTKVRLTIFGTEVFEEFIANDSFASVFSGPYGNGLEIDLYKLAALSMSSGGKAIATVAKYLVHVPDDDADFFAPLLANPIWRFDSGSASLLFAYQYNDDLISKLNISDVRILATVSDGGNLISAKMKPEGLWSPEKRSVLWAVGGLECSNSGELSPGSIHTSSSLGEREPLKLMARIESSTLPTSGTVAIQFHANGGLLSGIDIDMGVDQVAILTEVVKSITSGKYMCLQ
ncbi:Muniscin C-terminal mu homology domain-containing protein [Chytriomyces sp. MP71]|nr:Muniscin C-terminal mu homology domain-containing protein [Chytriomyces sp. MP71]